MILSLILDTYLRPHPTVHRSIWVSFSSFSWLCRTRVTHHLYRRTHHRRPVRSPLLSKNKKIRSINIIARNNHVCIFKSKIYLFVLSNLMFICGFIMIMKSRRNKSTFGKNRLDTTKNGGYLNLEGLNLTRQTNIIPKLL